MTSCATRSCATLLLLFLLQHGAIGAAGFHPAFWPDCVRAASPDFGGLENAERPRPSINRFLTLNAVTEG
jgi:hypothetical protein